MGGGSGAHPRLTAGNPPHQPLKGIPSFRDILWLQPSSEDGGSEPALWHCSEGCQPAIQRDWAWHFPDLYRRPGRAVMQSPPSARPRELILHGHKMTRRKVSWALREHQSSIV